jgi:protein-S-isoprenylcysteine O-methyltransferase Ste14
MTTLIAAKIIWCVGMIAWFVIRYPHARRSRRTAKQRVAYRKLELLLLSISALGLGVIPAIYVFSGQPRFANYPLQTWQVLAGALTFLAALYLFRRTHSALGRNWSVTLEVRENHALITDGIYKYVRHPMYSAFWLWAIAQAFLLPNWVAGFAGIAGFGTLYLIRVRHEEQMMLETFGQAYAEYERRTGRVFPKLKRTPKD